MIVMSRTATELMNVLWRLWATDPRTECLRAEEFRLREMPYTPAKIISKSGCRNRVERRFQKQQSLREQAATAGGCL